MMGTGTVAATVATEAGVDGVEGGGDRAVVRRPAAAGLRLALWGAVALTVALAVIEYMTRRGRLSTSPDWDDVMYMGYAAARLNELHDGGLMACLAGFGRNTPHSPVLCALALASFVVFGLREWAPYVGSALVVWSAFATADWVMGRAAFRVKGLAVLYLCTVPAVTLAVCEFKPDMAWGVCVGAAAFVSILRPLVGAPPWRLVVIGLLWAGGMLTKSTTAPATVGLMGLSLLLATAKDWGVTGRRPGVRAAARAWAWVSAVGLLVAAPHFWANWGYFQYYIKQSMFGEYRDVWRVAGGWRAQLAFFLTGEGGRQNLAGHLALMPVVWAIGLALAAARRDRATLWRAAAILVFLLACYAQPTINPLKNSLIAAPMFCVAMFVTAFWVGYVGQWEWARFATTWRTAGMVVAMIVAGAFLYQWPGKYYPPGSPEPAQGRRLHDEVYAAIERRARKYPQVVTVMGTGPVREITLAWMAACGDARFKFDRPYSSRASDYVAYADRSDFVLAQEDRVLGCAAYMPNEQGTVQSDVLAMMRGRDDYRALSEFTAADGKKLVLFERTRWTRGVLLGVRAVGGFGPVRGPYPKSTPPLPLFCWGTGGGSEVVLWPERPGAAATLRFECRATDHVESLRVVTAAGAVLGTHRFARPWTSETFDVAVPAARDGTELRFEYVGGPKGGPKAGENAVLFTKVELVQEGEAGGSK